MTRYLAKCFDKHYEGRGEAQKLKDLGHKPGQKVIGPEFNKQDLERIMATLPSD